MFEAHHFGSNQTADDVKLQLNVQIQSGPSASLALEVAGKQVATLDAPAFAPVNVWTHLAVVQDASGGAASFNGVVKFQAGGLLPQP